MVSRPIWHGHLRLALVSCPIALYSAVRGSGGLHFHLINPETGHRVRMVTLDAETGKEVARRDLVKGYEFEKDRYVLLDDADFEQARIDSSSILTINKFVEANAIDPVWFDAAYYVAPDGDTGRDVFAVLRDALRKTRSAALSHVVIARRERAVAILAAGKGMVCHTLHDPHEIVDAAPLWDDIPDIRPTPDQDTADMIGLATQLIARRNGRFQPEDTIDRYEARLREVIEAKLKGEGITPEPPEEPSRDNVIDLMAALKASLGQTPPKQPAQKRPGHKQPADTQPARKHAAATTTRKPARKHAS